MAVVVIDVTIFKAMYPQFANLADMQIQNAFNQACLLCDNTEGSPIPFIQDTNTERESLLYLLTCHILTLSQRGDTVVGNLSSASEGSVSASFSMQTRATNAWYAQTQWGLMFWQATAKYRTGKYYGRHYGRC